MTAKTTKMDVPDIGNLLGKITKKQESGELGKTDRQKVVPVNEPEQQIVKTESQPDSTTATQEIVKSFPQENNLTPQPPVTPKIGRPTAKRRDIEYVRLGAVIPKSIRQKMVDALNYEVFHMENGQPIRTVDEIVTFALWQLLNSKVIKK
jgi:hypothetical protein